MQINGAFTMLKNDEYQETGEIVLFPAIFKLHRTLFLFTDRRVVETF